jgi:hypothetical protein
LLQSLLWWLEQSLFRIAPQQAALVNYFIGAREKGRRNRDAKGFGGLEVNRQLEFRGLHDRQIGKLFAFQNASRVRTGFPMGIREAEAADCGAALR